MSEAPNISGEVDIRPEGPGDGPRVADLSARAFGPGRFARTAYRVREAARPALALTAWRDGQLVGAIRFTAITIGGAGGPMLLGPLAVEPAFVGQGHGRELVREGLARAGEMGCRLVILVGDLPYYGRLGFVPVPEGRIVLPGPVDPARLLAADLTPGALDEFHGDVRAATALP